MPVDIGCLNEIRKETRDEEKEYENGKTTTEGQGNRKRRLQKAGTD